MVSLQKEPPGPPEAPSDIKKQARRIILGQLVLLGFLALVALAAGARPLGIGLGILAGLGDTLLVLWGILSGMENHPSRRRFPCTGLCSCALEYCSSGQWLR